MEPVAWRWKFKGDYNWTLSNSKPVCADHPGVICQPLCIMQGSAESAGEVHYPPKNEHRLDRGQNPALATNILK